MKQLISVIGMLCVFGCGNDDLYNACVNACEERQLCTKQLGLPLEHRTVGMCTDQCVADAEEYDWESGIEAAYHKCNNERGCSYLICTGELEPE